MKTKPFYRDYIDILENELVPAMGCTEPIALAYGAAYCRSVLGEEPKQILAECSGNIVKNVRCVIIPHSNGMAGIETAVVLGALGGDHKKELEVLTTVKQHHIDEAKAFIESRRCFVKLLDSATPLHFIITMEGERNSALVEIGESHTNVVRVEKNGEVLLKKDFKGYEESINYGALNLDDIKAFADGVDLDDVRELLDRQIECNMAICREGMKGGYGVGIGKIIKSSYPDEVITRMKSMASSGSEARMGGCEYPVIVNSGSGNQGITASVPVIVYAESMGLSMETLYRGLVFSNLLTVYQKMYIGKLSAFCGVVSAGCAAGAAITYMLDGSVERIQKTIENTLANIPGIICDGAKVSCAAKIATSIDAAYLAHRMAMNDAVYIANTGILQKTTSKTISCVGTIGKDGMRETDREILKIILDSDEDK